jgi:hypothetical protein
LGFNGDLYPTAGATSVLSTKGDLVRYDSERERYGIGSTNQVLTVVAGLPAWATASGGATTTATEDALTGDQLTSSSSFIDTAMSITCGSSSGIFLATAQMNFKMSSSETIGDFRYVDGVTNQSGLQQTAINAGVENGVPLVHCGDASSQAIKIQIASNDGSTDMTLFGASSSRRSLLCLIEVS